TRLLFIKALLEMNEPLPDSPQRDGQAAVPVPELTQASAGPVTTAELPAPNGPAAEQPPEASLERRAAPRRRKQIAALIADVDGLQDPCRAWIMDRSLGGLCL